MKKLLLLIAAVMFFSVAANAQRVTLDGFWKASDNPNPVQFTEFNSSSPMFIGFVIDPTHKGAGHWISPTEARLVQTFNGGGCAIDMYIKLTKKSNDLLDVQYEFLESKCGRVKGAVGTATLTRMPGNRPITLQ